MVDNKIRTDVSILSGATGDSLTPEKNSKKEKGYEITYNFVFKKGYNSKSRY